MAIGRIIKIIGGLYTIYDSETQKEYISQVRGKFRAIVVDKDSSFNKQTSLKTKIETKTIKLSPKVGDIINYSLEGNKALIEEVLPRKNELVRPFISNVDQILLIFAAKEPAFSFLLLDLFILLLEQENIKGVIVITKVDLLSEEEYIDLSSKLKYYENMGYEIYYIDSKHKLGFDIIADIFKNNVTVLAGQTGAGKSTFLNKLIPGFVLKTQEISQALGRGKHTTRHTELYQYNNGFIGDTPGFSKLDLSFLTKEEIKNYFKEFREYSCKFRTCCHIDEPGCAVKEALKKGIILNSRYESYLKFYEEVKNAPKKY